jgi:activator of HSP90 ATPase
LKITISGDDFEISDGYHTMHELYQHRMALNIALFHIIDIYMKYPNGPQVFKSKLHNDGTMFDGYFIVMAVIPNIGQISYHYKLKHWDEFHIKEVEKTPEYDGHTSLDILTRLVQIGEAND